MSNKYPIKIVILDDDLEIRQSIKILIRNIFKRSDSFFELYTSSEGVEGLGYIYIVNPEIIIIDTTLPKYSGKEIIDYITFNNKFDNKYVIVLNDQDLKIELKEKNYYIIKKSDKNFINKFEDIIYDYLIKVNEPKFLLDRYTKDYAIHFKKKSLLNKLQYWLINLNIRWSNKADLARINKDKVKFIIFKLIFSLFHLFYKIIAGFPLSLLLLFAGSVKDNNIKQIKKDNARFRVRAYPTLSLMISSLIIVLVQFLAYLAGGVLIFGNLKITTIFATNNKEVSLNLINSQYDSEEINISNKIVTLNKLKNLDSSKLKDMNKVQPLSFPKDIEESLITQSKSQVTRYPKNKPSITFNEKIIFDQLKVISEESNINTKEQSIEFQTIDDSKDIDQLHYDKFLINKGLITYQLSPNKSDWYYSVKGIWNKTDQGWLTSNTVQEINKHLNDYQNQIGGNELYLRAFFWSNGDNQVTLKNISIDREIKLISNTNQSQVLNKAPDDKLILDVGKILIITSYPKDSLEIDKTQKPLSYSSSSTISLEDKKFNNITELPSPIILNASFSQGNKVIEGRLDNVIISDDEINKFSVNVYFTNSKDIKINASDKQGLIGKTSLLKAVINNKPFYYFNLRAESNPGGYVTSELIYNGIDKDNKAINLRSNLSKPIENSTFTVTTTNDLVDNNPGDGLCSTGVPGQCSLRAAIMESNILGGSNNIFFNIPTTDPEFVTYSNSSIPNSGSALDGQSYWTIRPLSVLPDILSNVQIDGSTQLNQITTNSGRAEVEIKGMGNTNFIGLSLTSNKSSNSTINKVILNNFTSSIYLNNTSNIIVKGCYIGTDSKALLAISNDIGIELRDNVINTTIGGLNSNDRNIISGNNTGISTGGGLGAGGSSIINIINNYIGLDYTGLNALPNQDGIYSGRVFSNINIGNSTLQGRNVIAGNINHDIHLQVGTNNALIRGNYIGLGMDGKTFLPSNFEIAIDSGSNHNTIGGTNLADRNFISGGNLSTIWIWDNQNTSYNTVINNYIGTDINGDMLSNSIYNNPGVFGSGVVMGIGATDTNNIVGMLGAGNLIKAHTGIVNDGSLNSSISNNTIAEANTAIFILVTQLSTTPPGNGNTSSDGVVVNNFIGSSINQLNQKDPFFGKVVGGNNTGILLSASSPLITGNNIVNNKNFGIKLTNYYGAKASRVDAANDYFSRPIIGGGGLLSNKISNNGFGGILSIDTIPSNESTLYSDNNFLIGNGIGGAKNIEQAWYGIFQLFSNNVRRTDLTNGSFTSNFPTNSRIRLTDDPTTNISSGSNLNLSCSTPSDCPEAGATSGIDGQGSFIAPNGALLSDERTWYIISEYIVDNSGNKINYGKFKFDQPHLSSTSFSFDGNSLTDPKPNPGVGEPWTDKYNANRDISSGNFGRFQIMNINLVDANPVFNGTNYIITVDSTSDEDNISLNGLANGKTSLREAIVVSNNFANPVTIVFNIPKTDHNYDVSSATWTIQSDNDNAYTLSSPYGIILDGSSQPGFTNQIGGVIKIITNINKSLFVGDGSNSSFNYLTFKTSGACVSELGFSVAAKKITISNSLFDSVTNVVNDCWHISDIGDDGKLNNNIFKNRSKGVRINSPNNPVQIINNQFYNVISSAIGSQTYGSAQGSGGIIKNNIIDGFSDQAISLQCKGLCDIENNTLQNGDNLKVNSVQSSLSLTVNDGSTSTLLIRNNSSNHNNLTGISVLSNGSGMISYMDISNNAFKASNKNYTFQLYTQPSSSINIANNIINNTSQQSLGGIYLTNGVIHNNTIFTSSKGIVVPSGNNKVTINNNIIKTSGIGIDIQGGSEDSFSVNSNIAGDVGVGANQLQNWPIIKKVTYQGGGVYLIEGNLDQNISRTPYIIEVCESDQNISGHGGCIKSLGSTSANNSWSLLVTYLGDSGSEGRSFTALATNINGATSEFGNNYTLAIPINSSVSSSNSNNSSISGNIPTSFLNSFNNSSISSKANSDNYQQSSSQSATIKVNYNLKLNIENIVTNLNFISSIILSWNNTENSPPSNSTYRLSISNANNNIVILKEKLSLNQLSYEIKTDELKLLTRDKIYVAKIALISSSGELLTETIKDFTYEPKKNQLVNELTNLPPDSTNSFKLNQQFLVFDSLAIVTPSIFLSLVTSSSNNIFGFIGIFFGILIPKKRKYWGVVYNKSKNKTTPFANIYVKDKQTGVIYHTVSDLDGVYGLLVDKVGEYTLTCKANGFIPFTKTIEIKEDLEVIEDIPLIAPENILNFILLNKKEVYIFINRILLLFVLMGFIYSIINLIYDLSLINICIVTAYFILTILNLLTQSKIFSPRTRGKVTSISDNKELVGVSLRFYDGKKQVGIALSNNNGEFKLRLLSGVFQCLVYKEGYKISNKNTIINNKFIQVEIDSKGYIKQSIFLEKIDLKDQSNNNLLENPFQ